jgi:large subunit ribosomal protein L21
MKYAIIKLGGTQYKVSEGSKIEVNKLPNKEGEILDIKEVVLLSDEGKIKVGKPLLKEVSVKAKVEKQYQGEKLHIYKFKAKTGYRRKTGFRAQLTSLTIEKIVS